MVPARSIHQSLTQVPDAGDVMSTVRLTTVGAIATAANAFLYAVASLGHESFLFEAIWLAITVAACTWIGVRSRKASRVKVTRVSRRAARRLLVFSCFMALPWVVLPLYVIGLGGDGDPMVVVMVCVGTLTGGAFLLYRTTLAAMVYFGSILLSLLISAHIGQWAQAWPLTGYAAVYFCFLVYTSYLTGQTARERDIVVEKLSETVAELQSARDANYMLANTDKITGLLNRHAFSKELARCVDRSAGAAEGFALLVMDLDRFKNVNDTFGHATGDELLAEFGRRLLSVLESEDKVARLGGDEFAVILRSARDSAAQRAVCDRIIAIMQQPIVLGRFTVYSGTSVGAAIYPQHAEQADALMVRADLALAHAKESGRGALIVYSDALQHDVQNKDRVEGAVRAALRDGGLFLEYQPQIDMHTQACVGVEALLRMRRSDGSSVAPGEFLSVATDRGLMKEISRSVARRMAEDLSPLVRSGVLKQRVSLNVHPFDLKFPELLRGNIDLLARSGLTHEFLTLEITEDVFLGRGMDHALFAIDDFAERGYRISLDDFGTGHASLTHLKSVPISEIKIDRSFMSGIERSRSDRAIVSAVANLAKNMGARCVGEGIETDAQKGIAISLGIDVGQGYLWSRSVPVGKLADLLTTGALGPVAQPGRGDAAAG